MRVPSVPDECDCSAMGGAMAHGIVRHCGAGTEQKCVNSLIGQLDRFARFIEDEHQRCLNYTNARRGRQLPSTMSEVRRIGFDWGRCKGPRLMPRIAKAASAKVGLRTG